MNWESKERTEFREEWDTINYLDIFLLKLIKKLKNKIFPSIRQIMLTEHRYCLWCG